MEDILREILNTLNKFDWVSFLLSLITIIISIAAIIFAIITDKKLAKNSAKITLLETRINFYNDCINTYNLLKGSFSHILFCNTETLATLIKNLEEQENKLMKCANTCQFLFNGDKIICQTVKDLYLKFSKYVNFFSKYLIEESDNHGFIKYIESKNLNPKELFNSNISKVIKLSKEYNKSNSSEVIQLATDIENILSSEEFDNMFKSYINTKI